jgi:hypothetical protein
MVWYSAIYVSISSLLRYDNRLGNHAFHHVLSWKLPNYKTLVIWLNFELRRARYRPYQRRFKYLVEEAQVVFKEIST